jgi:hypothetical protein
METEGPGFAVIDEDGVAFHVAATYDEAMAAAAEAVPDADVWYEGPPPWESEPAEAIAANGEVVQLRTKKNRFDASTMSPLSGSFALQMPSACIRELKTQQP